MDYSRVNSNRVFLLIEDYCIDGLCLKIVRDDIFPFVGGGSKARKAIEYEVELKNNGFNAVVTCGGIQSNHNRAIALMCSRNGWESHLCIQGSKDRFYREKGNALLDRLSGAELEFIAPEQTAEAMEKAMERFRSRGLSPYYVRGGGHDLPGGKSFVKAVVEVKRQCDLLEWKPEYIFLPSGTGSTQAGIIVGLELIGWSDVMVVGISVARSSERGRKVIIDFANMLSASFGVEKDYSDRVFFLDDYLFGGYECYTPNMSSFLDSISCKTGLVFDTTYSGKGFYGMYEEIKINDLFDRRILFWHTGGIMNLMK